MGDPKHVLHEISGNESSCIFAGSYNEQCYVLVEVPDNCHEWIIDIEGYGTTSLPLSIKVIFNALLGDIEEETQMYAYASNRS
jgi:hypothetical protein